LHHDWGAARHLKVLRDPEVDGGINLLARVFALHGKVLLRWANSDSGPALPVSGQGIVPLPGNRFPVQTSSDVCLTSSILTILLLAGIINRAAITEGKDEMRLQHFSKAASSSQK
jgi:hypothetical protein